MTAQCMTPLLDPPPGTIDPVAYLGGHGGPLPAPFATNVTEGAALDAALARGYGAVFDRLATHCGPYARNAVLPLQGQTGVFHIHTKDGIDIVNAMAFSGDKAAEAARQLAAYVGSRVDAACHDGTTTAMMLFAGLAKRCRGLHGTPRAIERAILRVLDALLAVVEAQTLTVADLARDFAIDEREAKRRVAYHQAMIASKGDDELARAIVAVVDAIPVELYGQYVIKKAAVEGTTRFNVATQEADFVLPATIQADHLNHALHTQYLGENVTLLVTREQLVAGNPEYDYLCKLLTAKLAELDDPQPLPAPLVIVAPKIEGQLINLIAGYNDQFRASGHLVVPATMTLSRGSNRFAMADAVQAMSGTPSLYDMLAHGGDPARAFLQNVRVHYKHFNLHLTGLYEKDGGAYHPWYVDRSANPRYTQLVDELVEHLSAIARGHNAQAYTDQLISDIITIYRQLVCQKIVDIELAGNTYDHLADDSVVKDAFGAVTSALDKGFIVGGLARLLTSLVHHPSAEDALTAEVEALVLATLTEILEIIYFGRTGAAAAPTPLFDLGASHSLYCYHRMPAHDGAAIERVEATAADLAIPAEAATTAVLLQPVVGYTELLKRLKELLPKIATAVCYLDMD